MRALWPSKKGKLFLPGEVFFFLPARRLCGGTCPLMGDAIVFIRWVGENCK